MGNRKKIQILAKAITVIMCTVAQNKATEPPGRHPQAVGGVTHFLTMTPNSTDVLNWDSPQHWAYVMVSDPLNFWHRFECVRSILSMNIINIHFLTNAAFMGINLTHHKDSHLGISLQFALRCSIIDPNSLDLGPLMRYLGALTNLLAALDEYKQACKDSAPETD
jgi:hypothetical protein